MYFNAEFINFICLFIFLLVEIWLGIWVMMFLYKKNVILNIFLICIHKSKVTLNMKLEEYMFTSRAIIIYPILLIKVKWNVTIFLEI